MPFIFELREIPRAKRVPPSPLLSLHFFFPLFFYLSALLSCSFVDRVILAPGEATKPGEKWGNGERRVARSLVFLILEMVMEDRKKGVEFGIECSFLFFFSSFSFRIEMIFVCSDSEKKRTDVRVEMEWVE